jgi:hypothetical protein
MYETYYSQATGTNCDPARLYESLIWNDEKSLPAIFWCLYGDSD